jgi:putative CocE/NonD family hydrolase
MPVSSSIHVDLGPSHGVRLTRHRVPMRDGVGLNAAVYHPRAAKAGVPAVVELTPYTIETAHGEGQYFPRRGFAYVVADVRGRGDSEGEMTATVNDAQDGYDLIEWIVQQPWSDGRVVLYGGSYTGNNQWLMLGSGHPAIAAASPAAAFAYAIDIPRGGIPNLYDAKWRGMTWGKVNYALSGADNGLWVQEINAAIEEGRPVWTAAEAFGVPYDATLRRLMESPDLGPAWAPYYAPDDQVARITAPVLTVSGTHDDCLPGTLHHWARFEQLAPAETRAASRILIGPWDHAGTDSGHNVVGDLHFGDAAKVDLRTLRTDWFRHVLYGEPEPALLSDRVVYYVAGAEQWRSAASLAEATATTTALYPVSTPGPNDVFHSGWLAGEPGDGPDYSVRLDPADERTRRLEMEPRPGAAPDNPLFPLAYNSLLMTQGGNDPTNQLFTVSVDGEGVVYHSAPFTEPLTVTGKPALRLRVVPDAEDADLSIMLHEVRQDGQTIFLSSDLIRLSRRDRGGDPLPLVAGEENEVDITDFRFCARELARGSRLRLTIRAAWSPLILPAADGLTSHPAVTLLLVHRADDPAVLTLPLGTDR